jgi:PAS domain S-box-containing protein
MSEMMQPIALWSLAAPANCQCPEYWGDIIRAIFSSAASKALFPDAEISRDLFAKLLRPEDIARDHAAWIAALDPQGSRVYDLIYPIRRPSDGAERWINSRAQVEFDGDRPIRIMGALRDVTEENFAKFAPERVNRSEDQLSLFIECAPAAIAMLDRDLRYLAASARWRAYLMIEQDPVGRRHCDVCPNFPPSWNSMHAACLAGAVESSEGEPFRCADGEVRWMRWEAHPWRDGTGAIGGIVVSAEDITARREAEAVAMHLAAIVTSSHEAIVSKNRDRIITSWNAAATKLLGFTPDEIIGQSINRIIPPECLDEERRIVERLMANAGVDHFETRRMAKDGRRLDVSLTISPIKDASGATLGACTILHDISERKHAEMALRESEALLRIALHAARAMAFQWNVVTGEASWSPEAATLLGVDPTAPPTYAIWLESVHPEDREIVDGAMRAAVEKQTSQYQTEYRLVLPSGELRWIAAIGDVDFDPEGMPLRVSGINLDITSQKRGALALRESETALRRSQTLLRLAVDAARLTYANIDFSCQTVEVAENFSLVMGYAPLAPLGGASFLPEAMGSLLGHVAPMDRARVAGAFQQFLAGAETGRIEYRVIGDDRIERWIDGGWSLELGANGRPTIAFLTALDVTKIVDGREALAAAKAEAEDANRAKSKFLAAASHDLRQPVQSLTFMLAAIRRRVGAAPEIVQAVDMAERAVSSLSSLLTGILDISKLDAGVVEPVMECVDLGALILQLKDEYAPRAAEVGLVLRAAPQALYAWTDAALLERILRNLLENALRYTSRGGVLIGLRRKGENVRIDVIDTGRGIPENKQREIFEEFRQLDNPARDSSRGLGLGLAIVFRLAKLLGTRAEVSSRPGHGSRFSISLPLDHIGERIERTESELENLGGRILVIEDNLDLRQAFEFMLHEWSYETIAAATGEEAIEKASEENWRFDAIVADHRLGPGLNGVAAATEIARRANRAISTIIITGDTDKERIAEVHASGFAMLHKPVPAEELRNYLAQAISSC